MASITIDLTGDSDEEQELVSSPIYGTTFAESIVKVEDAEDEGETKVVPSPSVEPGSPGNFEISQSQPLHDGDDVGPFVGSFDPSEALLLVDTETIIPESIGSHAIGGTNAFDLMLDESAVPNVFADIDATAPWSSDGPCKHSSAGLCSTNFVDGGSVAVPEGAAFPADDDFEDYRNLEPEQVLTMYRTNNLVLENNGEEPDENGNSCMLQTTDNIRQQSTPLEKSTEDDVVMADWNDDSNNTHLELNAKAAAKFDRVKAIYNEKKANGTASGADDIQFIAAEAAEKRRLQNFERSQRIIDDEPKSTPQDQGYQDSESLFLPEVPDLPETKPPKRRAPSNRLNAQETREAIAMGNTTATSRKRGASPTGGNRRKKRNSSNGTPRKRSNRGSRPVLSNVRSLGRSNVVREAQANASRPNMPTFSSKNKAEALKELIASIPSAEMGAHISDRNAILEASKKFTGRGSVRSDGKGGWKLRGMSSSLYNHQLLGAAFLRDRENGSQRPFGGLVCDEMGFGKTIQMIANILDGKADAGSAIKTTLIIAPSSLLNQWMSELDRHVEPGRLGRILRFHSGARLYSNDTVADLREYDIILTSYGEIQKSYPACEPPKHLASEAAKNAWWADFYMKTVGPLHRIKYHRIVLDEAHHIKNHNSKTSIAVRALTGTFKWAITGTPILNYIEELFPYFSFLKVPHTGDFATFTHNYCDNRSRKDPVDMSRIHNILRAIMLRRTHADSLFNAPIVKLKGISHTTYALTFNDVERTIYNTVKRRYIHDINKIYKAGELNARYSNILAMISRLRMLCSHVLLCQDVMKQLFNAADIEALWRLTEREVQATNESERGAVITTLRKMIRSRSNTVATCQSTEADVISATTPEFEEQQELSSGGDFGIYFKFRRFLRELSQSEAWTELHLRSICAKCRLPPDEPICTSCFHVYCKECLNAMDYERQEQGKPKMACIECGAHFEETSPCIGLKELGFNSVAVAARIEEAKNRRAQPPPRGSKRKKNSASNAEGDEEQDKDWIELAGVTLSSSKLAATKAAILNWREQCPEEKIIIYTQFLGMVRLLEKLCKAEGWEYVQFTGKMTLPAREKAIQIFDKDKETRIMICSLKAGGVGLNLAMASKVIILDLWFNSSIEAQAYCRAFRLGQERKVEVLRFTIKDSIDEDLVQMQDRKDVEINGAIGPESHGQRATVTQLLSLFGEVVEDGQNEFILMEDEADDHADDDDDIATRLPPRPF